MILILPQIQFEALPSKDAGEVAFQSEADRSHKILGFCHKSFSLIAHMALILKFLDSQLKDLSKNVYLCPPPPIFISQVKAKYIKMCCGTPILTEPNKITKGILQNLYP